MVVSTDFLWVASKVALMAGLWDLTSVGQMVDWKVESTADLRDNNSAVL